MKHPKIPQTEVLAWLQEHYPELHAKAEIDRDWVWLAVDLRGDPTIPIRTAIKEYGFIFSRRGGHVLPSGAIGTWGHSCERPVRFFRKGNQSRQSDPKELTDDTILAMFG